MNQQQTDFNVLLWYRIQAVRADEENMSNSKIFISVNEENSISKDTKNLRIMDYNKIKTTNKNTNHGLEDMEVQWNADRNKEKRL